jgi:hypothetical protein
VIAEVLFDQLQAPVTAHTVRAVLIWASLYFEPLLALWSFDQAFLQLGLFFETYDRNL